MRDFTFHQSRRRRPANEFDFEPPDIDVQHELTKLSRRLPTILIWLLLIVLFLMLQGAPRFYTDWLWFKSMGQGSVFITRLTAPWAIFAAAALAFFVLFMVNVAVARRLSPAGASSTRFILLLATAAGLILSFAMGTVASSQWETILRYLNRSSFELVDPIFKQDVSFYIFTLPMYSLIQGWLTIGTVILIAAAVAIYALALGQFRLTSGVKAHLSGLGALFLVLFAWDYQLSIYKLMYSTRGVVYGASYTDVNAQWPAFTILTWITVLAALVLLVNVFVRATRALAITAGVWIVVTLILAQMYPTAIQTFDVRPNELTKETPYIKYNIEFTRRAFGLDEILQEDYPGEGAPSTADISRNADTVENIRLWDYRPLLDTYDQLQSIRQYYDFRDIDIDRYTINGKYRQVMLSAREMTQSRLPPLAQTWINLKLVYTHGYGVAMSPVNEIAPDGSPNFIVKNVPPVGAVPITRPAIYFGEKLDDYVIVGTRVPEFDYPLGDTNATTTYNGKDGVNVGSLINRILFTLRFGDTNIILSDAIKPESKVLMHRTIQERISLLAPFLILDHDPYIVIADGHLYWMQDAYTTTDLYPYSQPHPNGFNYIRNSVKVVVDAYDGTTTFYIADDEPIIRSWQGIFPTLFTPISEMPASLRAHVRYPEDFFRVQAEMLRTYHMLDPQVFYNKEDLWAMPREIYAEREQAMEPYFAIMRLPDGVREEFILLMPFTPANKQNMVAWLGAKSDGENYGKRVLYQMPKDKLVYGPMQIEARISQDTEISAQITLWSQSGSKVTRGNLLIIPIEKSFLYVEPLYLLAEQGQIPQLKRVIVSTAERVAMDENLTLALRRLFTGVVLTPSTTGPSAIQPSTTLSPEIVNLIRAANEHYQKAQEALKAGDWARYGEAQKALEGTLKTLTEMVGK